MGAETGKGGRAGGCKTTVLTIDVQVLLYVHSFDA